MLIRILTALVAAPIAIALTIWLSGSLFAEVVLLIMLVGLFEWNGLTTKSNVGFVAVAMIVLIVGVATYLLSYIFPGGWPLLPGIFIAGALFWVVQIAILAKGIDHQRPDLLEFCYGGFAILCAWAALVWLRHQPPAGTLLVLIAMAVVWAADSCAYFSGKAFGRHKLAPSISPGKTIEGVVGGVLGAGLLAWMGGKYLIGFGSAELIAWLAACMVAALISVVGDLYISRLKRQAGVKDTGNVLPGHGGVLDRLDGLIAAMPVLAALWWLLG